MKKLKASIKMIRPANSIMMGIAIMVGIKVSDPSMMSLDNISLLTSAFLVGFFLSSSSMVFNDYIDYKIDAINNPSKPIPAGIITRKFALIYSLVLALIGIFFAFLLNNLASLFIALSGISIAYIYNLFLKKRGIYGNIAVAYTTSLPFIFGSSLAGFYNLFPTLILCFLAFLSNLSRELVKGIVDILGDMAMGIKTIANSLGSAFASKLASSFIVSAVILSLLPLALGFFSFIYTPLLLISDSIFIYSTYLILKDPSKQNALKAKNYFLIAMLIALLYFFIASNY